MDRDKRWDRVDEGLSTLIATGAGEHADDPLAAVEAAYARGETDEFVLPTAIGGYARHEGRRRRCCSPISAPTACARSPPRCSIRNSPASSATKRSHFAAALGLVEYSAELNRFLATLFPPYDLSDTFGEVVAEAGLKQLRIAETEKYAHVTFFFNGGRETVFRRRGAHPGAVAEGRDLRSAAAKCRRPR